MTGSSSARRTNTKDVERNVDWDKAKKIKQANGLEVVVVPVQYKTNERPGVLFWDDQTPADQKKPSIENVLDVKESLLTFKDKTGQIQTQLVQYIPGKEYKKLKKGEISKDDFTGWVKAMTWDGTFIIGFEFKNGKDVKRLHPTNAGNKSGGRAASCDFYYFQNVSVNCYPCGNNCTSCDVSISGSYVGTCTDPSSNSGTDGNYGITYGGQGFGNYVPPATSVDIIVDPNLDDCTKSVINKLTSGKLKSHLAKVFTDLYGNNAGYKNIRFKAGSADGKLAQYSSDPDEIHVDRGLFPNASQEYIASVLFHEETHAILVDYRDALATPSQLEQHKTILTGWVDHIRDALLESYPSLTKEEATGLALGGLKDVITNENGQLLPSMEKFAKDTYGVSLSLSAVIINDFMTTRGTKCN